MSDQTTLLVPIRYSVIQMVKDGERRPICVSKPEWEMARLLVKYSPNDLVPSKAANISGNCLSH